MKDLASMSMFIITGFNHMTLDLAHFFAIKVQFLNGNNHSREEQFIWKNKNCNELNGKGNFLSKN